MTEERHCPACGKAAGPQDRFCSGCGAGLDSAPAGLRVLRPALNEVFAHLRSGEQRPATILMTDISGFTSLGEQVEPEWLFHLINQVFEELVDSLVAHGAHIDKYVGDEIVALFGVPVAQERSAERAILAALAMRERLSALSQQGRFGDVRLDIHTGINVGRVMVGPVGHRAYADYTVIGDAVNVAKRLEEEAPAGEIYVSRAVRDAVGDAFRFDRIGCITLAGRRQQAEAFRVIQARSAWNPARVFAPEAGIAPRDAELRRLAESCERARRGVRQVVCVAGPPGIGKSRLVAQWAGSEGLQGLQTACTACHAYGEHFPLLPLADLVAQLSGLHLENWPPRVAGDIGAGAAVLPVDEDTRATLVSFLASLGQPHGEAEHDWRGALNDGLARLLEGGRHPGPLCVVLEDVQWIDEASRALLEDVLTRESDRPPFVLLTAREPVPEWVGASLHAATVPLKPLPDDAIERLVAAWAAPAVLPASTVRAICDRAEGHPYFARELVHSLRGDPAGGVDAAQGALSLPGTLQELFLAQLDQLPIPLRRLVQAAAVAGEPLSHGLLEAAMHGDEPLTEDLLWEATRPGLLCAGPGPGQFTFGRRLLFEAAYATVPPSRRKDLHARIADHLVDQMNSTGESAIHAAAHHAYLGYQDERAIDLQIRSARQYRAQYANRQAIQTASRALELISAAPEPERLLNERLTALLLLAQSYQVVGEVDQAEAALGEAATLSDACEDQELVAQIATSAATLCWMQGKSGEAHDRFSQAHDAWRRLGDETRAAQALVGMGLCANQQGRRARALESFSEAARRDGVAAWVRAAALNNAGMMLLEEGRYAQAEPYLTKGLQANEEDGDRRGVAQSKCSLGELNYRLSRFGDARRWLEEALAESTDMEDAQGLVLATAYLARVHCMTGSACAAADLLAATASQPGPEFPEADAVFRAAQFEAAAACAEDAQPSRHRHAAPGLLPEPSGSDASHSGTCRNAYVETLCIAVEAALRPGSRPAAADVAAALAKHVPQAPDRHLRRYGDWLLGLVERSGPGVSHLPSAEDGEQTVYDARAQRLAQSLRPAPPA